MILSTDAYDAMSKSERDEWVKRETDEIMWQLDRLDAGLCVRRAGLIWRLPLCHDSFGEGI